VRERERERVCQIAVGGGGQGGPDGRGGAWCRWWFSGAVVTTTTVEAVREAVAWSQWWRRSVVLTVVHGCCGEGRADGVVFGRGGEGACGGYGGLCTVEADAEEERTPVAVWQ
jgi:hypothetical protein